MSAEQIMEQIFESDDELPEKLDGEVDKNCEPFCCYSNNKKTEVIRLTSIRLVQELLALLSCLSGDEVAEYFKRILAAGSRKGHKVWLVVSNEKDFVFT